MNPAASKHKLRSLMARPGLIRTLAPHDVFTAMIMEQAGLECLFLGGFGVSASMLGVPDLNLITVSEMADAIRRLTSRLSIPVIADGDTGHGDAHNIRRTVELFESAGAAGILIEDQVMPKRCGHFASKKVTSSEEFVRRIRTAVESRCDPDFLVFARTDALASHGVEEAIRRVNLAADVGAEAGFVEAPRTLEELATIPRRLKVPSLANMLTGGTTPIVSTSRLEELGYKFAVAPVESLMVTAGAIQSLCKAWLNEGRVDHLAAQAMPFANLKQALNVEHWLGTDPTSESGADDNRQ